MLSFTKRVCIVSPSYKLNDSSVELTITLAFIYNLTYHGITILTQTLLPLVVVSAVLRVTMDRCQFTLVNLLKLRLSDRKSNTHLPSGIFLNTALLTTSKPFKTMLFASSTMNTHLSLLSLLCKISLKLQELSHRRKLDRL